MNKKTAFFLALFSAIVTTGTALASPVNVGRAEIAKLTAEINHSLRQIDLLDEALERTTKDIIHTYQRLDAQEQALKVQRHALNLRIGEVYKNYNEMLLGIFLDARSLSDIWTRLAYLARISQADKDLLAANKFRLEQVRRLKLELSRKKQKQIDLRQKKQREYFRLQSALRQKKAKLEARLREIERERARNNSTLWRPTAVATATVSTSSTP